MKMLYYKAWRESRARFLLSALAIAGSCGFFVFYYEEAQVAVAGAAVPYIEYIWRITYKGYLREVFEVFVLFLGMGGLLRERIYGTATFTLGLPVSRGRLLLARGAVGVAEVALLALAPSLLIPGLSPWAHHSYPFSQALQFSLLWIVCGSMLFCFGLFASVLFGGEYSAAVISLIGILGYSYLVELPGVERYIPDIQDLMSGEGMPYFSADTSRIVGPLPWASLSVVVLVAGSLAYLAMRRTQAQDF